MGNNQCGYAGLTFHKGKYHVRINRVYIGAWENKENAAKVSGTYNLTERLLPHVIVIILLLLMGLLLNSISQSKVQGMEGK